MTTDTSKEKVSYVCDWAVAKDNMDWVIDRDPEAGRYWRDAMNRGMDPYDALLGRLLHNDKAHHSVVCCRTKGIEYLEERGFQRKR
ncbi:hypothetical protein GR212_15425 [Rhizobium lusitanum]|uniref:Uncharacterized protein n=1 Tax=Rhizobium lusitanum TaxID=293958 RepID=A0A6L9U6R4_9HYPH|nr:hypothetical protein [Rhizobium lusitanum]NEI70974.1 hypothetical protein [Rhizobium lusitanum]